MGGRGSWSSSSGGTFTPNPSGGGSGSGDQEKVLGPQIPSSLKEALGNVGKPMSSMKASKGTNPHYNASFEAYSSNCQRCVLTYEARRRGYDVTALPTYKGDMLPYSGDYLKALSNPKVVNTGKSVRKIESELRKYGSGSRAIISVRKGYNGHVFIAENNNGKIKYIDPQTNSNYSKLSLSSSTSSSIVRIDNQKFTEYAKNAFTRKRY